MGFDLGRLCAAGGISSRKNDLRVKSLGITTEKELERKDTILL